MPRFSLPNRAKLAVAAAMLMAIDTCWTSAPARAEVRSSGPFAAVGFTEKLDSDLVMPTLGWRWQLAACDTLESWASRVGADFSFVIEPAVAAIVGDEHTVEAQLVPFFHFEPQALVGRAWTPYFEAGVGLIYTGVDGLHLGSHVLFSDDFGGGLQFELPRMGARLGVGYRFRHISHAGIFGQPNSGMNTHYLTITLQ